jgi:predicted transcriptional regulator
MMLCGALRAAQSRIDGSMAAGYGDVVSIDLPRSVEKELRTLAEREGRDVGLIVEEAIRRYLEAAAITDLDANAVADAQAALLGELPELPDWKTGDG